MPAHVSQQKLPTDNGGNEEGEDDYMSMVITEPSKPRYEKETYTQRRTRKERESEVRGRTKSKKERQADEAAARDAALSTSLSPSNKGFQMMAKLGFKPGSALGKDQGARTEPLVVVLKDDRGGVGLDNERKRKFREEAEEQSKRVKAEETDYRERVRLEREVKRLEAQIVGAQKVAERLETAAEEEGIGANVFERLPKSGDQGATRGQEELLPSSKSKEKSQVKPLSQINVLWRGLIRHRIEKERERRIRYDLHQSLSRLPTYDHLEEDKDDRHALGNDNKQMMLEEEIEEEDAQLDEFNSLEPAERLGLLLHFLRDEHHYCFWCKHQYADKSMDGCPGITEEVHD